MQPSAERGAALLMIEGDGVRYAIPGAAVVSVEHLTDWKGDPPLDTTALLGLPPAAHELSTRVAVVSTGERDVPLLLRGTLTLLAVDASQLLSLPAPLQRLSPLISHVVVVDGKPAYLVLSPARLAQASSAVTSPPVS